LSLISGISALFGKNGKFLEGNMLLFSVIVIVIVIFGRENVIIYSIDCCILSWRHGLIETTVAMGREIESRQGIGW
jgi:hypothetical protein